jgi:hypothetical protein
MATLRIRIARLRLRVGSQHLSWPDSPSGVHFSTSVPITTYSTGASILLRHSASLPYRHTIESFDLQSQQTRVHDRIAGGHKQITVLGVARETWRVALRLRRLCSYVSMATGRVRSWCISTRWKWRGSHDEKASCSTGKISVDLHKREKQFLGDCKKNVCLLTMHLNRMAGSGDGISGSPQRVFPGGSGDDKASCSTCREDRSSQYADCRER